MNRNGWRLRSETFKRGSSKRLIGKLNMEHGSLNVSIEHHPTIRYMVYNGCYKVMSNIPKMGQLPTSMECACKKKNTRTEGARTCSTCAEWRVNASEHAAYSSSYCWHFFCHCSLCISTWTCSLHRTHVLYSSKNDVRKAVEKKNTEVFSFCLLYTYPVLYVNMYIYI